MRFRLRLRGRKKVAIKKEEVELIMVQRGLCWRLERRVKRGGEKV